MINRISLKEDAKSRVAAAVPSPTLPTAGFLLIIGILAAIQTNLDKRFEFLYKGFRLYLWNMGPFPLFHFSKVLTYSALFLIVLRLISEILSVGYSWYALRISRSIGATFLNIFDPMNMIFKVIGLTIVISLFCFLWSLLLIIPGIVAAYSYRQAYYILYDHPEYGILECIRASKKMMYGNKGELFILDLSFLGWHIVCLLTMGILYIWKLPYIEVTYCSFYDAVGGHASHEQNGRDNPNRYPWE